MQLQTTEEMKIALQEAVKLALFIEKICARNLEDITENKDTWKE